MERGTTCYANVGHMVGKKRVEMQRTVHITLSQFLPCVGGQKKVTSWRTWRSALSAKSRHRSVVARKPEMKNSNPAIEQSPGQTMACVKQMLFRGEQQSKSPNMASLFFRFILSNNRRPESFPLMDRRKPCRAGDLSRRYLHLITAKMAQQAARNRS